jgi:hypothetical protein
MKSGRIFWGTFFIIVGMLGVLHAFFGITLEWGSLWKLWPLLLVLLGISVFLRDTKYTWIVAAVIGLLTGVVLFSSVQYGCESAERLVDFSFDSEEGDVRISQTLAESFSDPAARAELLFEGGAGRFSIDDTTSEYMAVDVQSGISGYTLTRERTDDVDRFSLGMTESSVTWQGGKVRNRVAMKLNPSQVWDLRFQIGAAKLDLDLQPYLVRTLHLEAGAANIDVRLGNRSDSLAVFIETGASRVTLHLPEDVGCELRSEAALSSRKFEGFEKIDAGLYRTGKYEDASKFATIRIESGLSSLRIKRYDAGEKW